MYIMQNNESRLIKAAKRTIRAEVTLVIIIIVISSWSIYALYKFTSGSDSFFGLTFARANRQDKASNVSESFTSQVNLKPPFTDPNNLNNNQQQQNHFRSLNYSQQDDVKHRSQQLLQQLIAGQRELYANLDSFRSPLMSPLDPLRRVSLVQTNRLGDEGQFKMISSGYRQLPLPAQEQKQLSRLQVAERPQVASRGLSRLGYPDATIPAPEADDNKVDEDREAAESSRESSESVVDGTTQDSQSTTNDGDSSSSQSPDVEGSHNGEDASYEQDANDYQQDVPQTTTQASPEPSSELDQGYSSGDEPDTARNDEDAPPKETSQTIDDEVERMVQPSSGVVHQEDRPFDYKNTVQFDDSALTGFGSSTSSISRAVPAGHQVARFEAPPAATEDHDDDRARDLDLQMDHNSLVVRNNSNETARGTGDGILEHKGNKPGGTERRKKVITRRGVEKFANRANDTKANEHIVNFDVEPDKFNRANSRQKRDSPMRPREQTKIRAPYEIEYFLDGLDFESLLSQPSAPNIEARHSRALSSIDSGLDSARTETLLDGLKKSNSSERNIRRFGEDDNYAQTNDIEFRPNDVMRPTFTQIFGLANGSQPMPSYVTSNDSALQELLSQKQLLDALKYSQLPAPYQNDSGDTKTAGSLYHIDHGLALVPSAGMRHSHKTKEASESKKKKKHKKMKDKKKTTVAFKKGGHKKKKLKKEEKKYLKEKKFKGSKKGKKVSKGKGGAGGKKGKKLYKDKGYKKKGFKKVYHKEEWGNKKSFFDEFRDKDFKKKWKKFDDKYNYAKMKKFQAKDEKGAKKMKHQDESHKKYDKGKWKKSYHKKSKEHKESSKKNKKKKSEGYD